MTTLLHIEHGPTGSATDLYGITAWFDGHYRFTIAGSANGVHWETICRDVYIAEAIEHLSRYYPYEQARSIVLNVVGQLGEASNVD